MLRYIIDLTLHRINAQASAKFSFNMATWIEEHRRKYTFTESIRKIEVVLNLLKVADQIVKQSFTKAAWCNDVLMYLDTQLV